MTAVDPMIVQATKMLASQAYRTLDTVTREVMVGGTNVLYATKNGAPVTSRAAIDDTTLVDTKLFKKAAMILKRQNAPTIDGSYVAIIHPDVAYDIMNDEGWIDVHKYMDATKIFDGELGKIGNVRFVESTEAKIFMGEGSGSANVYATMVVGKGAYATTDITGGGLKHIVKPLGSAGSADPLDQRATVGWKAIKTAERLVEQYMVRIESGAAEGATAIAN
jgi:N4-gp56 family major capsid protein